MGVVVATEIRANSDYGSGRWLATRRLPDSFAIAAGIGAWSNSFVFADYCEAPHELASGSPQSMCLRLRPSCGVGRYGNTV